MDSLVLAVLGAAGGLLVAAWAGRALGAYLSGSSAQAFLAMSFTWRVLAFTAAIAGVTAVVSALLPAARVMRTAPIAVIRGQSSGSSSTARPALLSGLVVLQVAVSMVIVTATGLFVRTLDRLLREPLGFDGGSVLVARVDASRVSIDLIVPFATAPSTMKP